MRRLIYRRDNISIALKQNEFTSGCNLYIWYGYIEKASKQQDFIIDTSMIKKDLKVDLQEFDHACIDVHDSNDIVDSMIEVGHMIFKKAMVHPLIDELIVEDLFGDKVVIRSNQVIIYKKYLYNLLSNYAIFSCNDSLKHNLYGLSVQNSIFTCKENITEKQLQQLISNDNNKMQYYITYIDEASSTALTYFRKESIPEYITFCCIEHIAHQLPNLSISEKCGRLHGHTYRCYATIKNGSRMPITAEYVSCVEKKIRTYLRTAFEFREISTTTTENIISYVADKICNEYELTFIELSETPNIKARIYIEESMRGEVV